MAGHTDYEHRWNHQSREEYPGWSQGKLLASKRYTGARRQWRFMDSRGQRERKGTAKVESQGEGGQLCVQCCRKGREGKQEAGTELVSSDLSISLYGLGSPGVSTQSELQGLHSACEVSRWTQQHVLASVGKSFIPCLFNLKNRENATFPTRLTASQKPEWNRKGAMKILLHELLERIQHCNDQSQHQGFPAVAMGMRAASVSLSYASVNWGQWYAPQWVLWRLDGVCSTQGQSLAHSDYNFLSKLQNVVQVKVHDETDKADHYKRRKTQTPERLKDKSLHGK